MGIRSVAVAALAAMCCTASASAHLFNDDFDSGNLDSSKWYFSGPIQAGASSVILLPNVGYFPVVQTLSSPFPASGPFVLTVRMRWPAYGGYGNGLTPGYYALGRGFGAWSDICCSWVGHAGAISVSCGETYPIQVTSFPDTAWHVYQWQYSGGVYTFYFDGALRASSASSFKPTMIRFGATNAQSSNGWNTLEVDYVRVDAGYITDVRLPSWGRLKAVYR